MRSRSQIILFSLGLFSLLACSKSSDNQTGNSEDLAKIDTLASYLDEIHCPGSASECYEVSATYDKSRFDQSRFAAQTILVIDSDINIYATMKYRNRVKNVYQLDAAGQLQEFQPTLKMPRYLDTLFNKMAEQGSPRAYDLKPIADRLKEITKVYEDRYQAGHGDIPLQFILEQNPEASVVLIDSLDPFSTFSQEFCSRDTSKFKARIVDLAGQLYGKVIAANKVQYINYSAGITPASIQEDFSRVCGSQLSQLDLDGFVDAIKPFYETLFATPNVLGIQAGTTYDKTPLDCSVEGFPNRVRAGYYTALKSGLDAQGRLTESDSDLQASIPDGQRQVLDCLDILINYGIKTVRPFPYNETPYMVANIFGLNETPISFGQTSWAPPLVLSRVIHIVTEELGNPPLTDSVIKTVKQRLTPGGCDWVPGGTCKYQDPLKHAQVLSHIRNPK